MTMNATQTIKLPRGMKLSHGSHSTYGDGACALEMADYLDRRRRGVKVTNTDVLTDSPACVSPVIATFGRSWNDGMRSDEERTRILGPLLPLMLDTATTAEDEAARSWMALDWLVRVHTPAWLTLVKLPAEADALRALAPIVDAATARASDAALTDAKRKAAAARDAAWAAAGTAAGAAAGAAARDAAWAAARDAAWAAAGDAAGAAARDAAGAAAGDAAGAAARDAAGAAARDAAGAAAGAAARAAARDAAGAAAGEAARAAVADLQVSAADLVKRLCAVGRHQ